MTLVQQNAWDCCTHVIKIQGGWRSCKFIEELDMQKENEGHLCDEDLKMSSDERTSISSTGV